MIEAIEDTNLFQRMMLVIDHQEMYAIRQRYPQSMWDKFFDVSAFVSRGAEHALRLTEHIPKRSRCLDLGTAFGYVALGLTALGHRVVCVDQGFDILREVSRSVPAGSWVFLKITPDYKPAGQFNLIYAHGLIPMRNGPDWRAGPGLWTEADYESFAGHLIDALAPGGIMEWIINRGEEAGPAYSVAAWERLKATKPISYTIEDNVVTVFRLKSAEAACVVS